MDIETGIPVNQSEWKNGTVVALKSHFYTEQINSDLIVYSGEPKLISPLMVIVETMPEKKSYHPTTGDLLDEKEDKSYQCKCTWFSSKNFHFEEIWISSRLLRIIKPVDEIITYKHGDLVELRGAEIELGKKKSSLKLKNNDSETSVTAELSFVSPIMQMIGTMKNEIKEPLRDLNTQKPKRYISKTLVKCKYYNSASEKMTEVLIPIDALNKIPEFDTSFLNPLKDAIEGKKYLILTVNSARDKEQKKKILVDPKKVNYRAGRYYLSAFNFFSVKTQEFKLPIDYTIPDPWFTEELPSFKEQSGKLQYHLPNPETVKEVVDRIGKTKHLLITYHDFNGVETKRVITNLQFITEEAETPTIYLKAFCYLRNDIRYFKIEGVKSLKVLNV